MTRENKLLAGVKEHLETELTKILNGLDSLDTVKKYTVDAAKMPNREKFSGFDCRTEDEYFGKMFAELDTIDQPVIYWWTCGTKAEAQVAHKKLLAFRKKKKHHGRNVPPDNKNKDSRCLYLGKRNGKITKRKKYSAITSRIYQHLGYYSKGSQGLQLWYWSQEQFTLNILVVPKKLQPYLETFEKSLSIKFKPLLGRH